MTYFLQIWLMRIYASKLLTLFYSKHFALIVSAILLFAYPSVAQIDPIYLTNSNGILFFAANSEFGQELWRSNGTAEGTYMVKDINPDYSSEPNDLTDVNGTLFFSANITASTTFHGSELWKSDGTAEGTVLVKNFNTLAPGSSLRHLTNVNGTLYFLVEVSLDEYQLWKSNGTEATTIKLSTFTPPPSEKYQLTSIDHLRLVNGNGTLYFTADDSTNGLELWKSNGTSAGTGLVKDINPKGDAEIYSLAYWNGHVYFAANDGSKAGRELWKSNGTPAGTVMVKDIAPAGTDSGGNAYPVDSSPSDFAVFKGALYFVAHTDDGRYTTNYNRELWKTDGTAPGTVLVKDIAPGPAGSYPSVLTVVNGTLFFGADKEGKAESDGSTGYIPNRQELWKSNGTTAGTVLVKDFKADLTFRELVGMNGTLFFSFSSETIDGELWKSDGTEPGTVLIKNIRPNGQYPSSSSPSGLTVVNNTLYFIAHDGDSWDLWKSNGTAASTIKIRAAASDDCTATGSILREFWVNVPGTSTNDIPLHTAPSFSTQLTSFEAPSNIGDNYGQRIRGYICAPVTGNYTFYIAGDDNCALFLSTDDERANMRTIASVPRWTYEREWAKYPSQKSATISLQAGKKYYIEALHKEAAGGDRVAVGWQLPNSSVVEVIPGYALSPYIPVSAARVASTEPASALSLQVYPNPSTGERIQVELKGLEGNQPAQLNLYNSLGTNMLQQQVAAGDAGTVNERLNLGSKLPSGIYILKAESQNKTVTQRVVIYQ